MSTAILGPSFLLTNMEIYTHVLAIAIASPPHESHMKDLTKDIDVLIV